MLGMLPSVLTSEQLSALPPEIRLVIESLVAHYEARIAALECELQATQVELAATKAELAKARKNSATSSKPPSSDLVKPPKSPAPTGTKRKRGGQPGHPKHQRPPFGPDQIDRIESHRLDACPQCGGPLELLDAPPLVLQQVEVVSRPIEVIEHRGHVCCCGRCCRDFAAPLPRAIQAAGLVGPR